MEKVKQRPADKRTSRYSDKKADKKLAMYRASGPSHMEETASTCQTQLAHHRFFKRNWVSRQSPLQNLVPVENGELYTIAVLLFVSFNDINGRITCQ